MPIVALAILMGVLPNLFLRPMEPSVERMLNQVRRAPTPVAVQAAVASRSADWSRSTVNAVVRDHR